MNETAGFSKYTSCQAFGSFTAEPRIPDKRVEQQVPRRYQPDLRKAYPESKHHSRASAHERIDFAHIQFCALVH